LTFHKQVYITTSEFKLRLNKIIFLHFSKIELYTIILLTILDYKMETTEKLVETSDMKVYVSPQIEIIELVVKKGFECQANGQDEYGVDCTYKL